MALVRKRALALKKKKGHKGAGPAYQNWFGEKHNEISIPVDGIGHDTIKRKKEMSRQAFRRGRLLTLQDVGQMGTGVKSAGWDSRMRV